MVLLAVLVFIASFRSTRFVGIILAIIAGLFFGSWRMGGYQIQQQAIKSYIGKEVSLYGRVVEDPTIGIDGDTKMRVHVETINNVGSNSSEIWIAITQNSLVKRSDMVLVRGKISSGFGTFSATMYRADLLAVSRSDYADVARDVRDSFAESVRKGIDEPEGSLAVGFLLGQKSELPEKLQNELRLIGLTHIVVASGYNLTILVRFARRFLMRVSRFGALSISFALIYIFTQMTGFTPSMTRASLITSLSLIAWYFGRVIHPFVLIPFAAAVTLVARPAYAMGDIGWLLSFGSFIGVIVLAPLIHAYFWGSQQTKVLRQIVVETVSAQIFTFPIILFAFGTFSPLSLPANVVVVPFIPFVMLFSFLGGIAGFASTIFANILSFAAEVLLHYITWVVERISLHPLASITLGVEAPIALFIYIVITIVTIFLWRRTSFDFQKTNFIE